VYKRSYLLRPTYLHLVTLQHARGRRGGLNNYFSLQQQRLVVLRHFSDFVSFPVKRDGGPTVCLNTLTLQPTLDYILSIINVGLINFNVFQL